MSEVEKLIHNYGRFVAMPWQTNLAGAQRVWFAVYDPKQERRVRLRLDEFQIATKAAGKKWHLVDLTNSFAQWMAGHRYRDAYFESPDDLDLALHNYAEALVQRLHEALTAPEIDDNTVVAVLGVATLFGLTRASGVLEKVTDGIRGRMLVLFPGHVEGSNYRLLDARDGWNYLAIPITA
ncbi:MAG: DUF1788 domain-containing protein [Ardenticatenia bacterium]|nr:DUF1788 domain-containing protein [Ardenticatenia bacterium]